MKITVESQECIKGHSFFPKIESDGTIIPYDRCPVTSCRISLHDVSEERLNRMIRKTQKQIRLLGTK